MHTPRARALRLVLLASLIAGCSTPQQPDAPPPTSSAPPRLLEGADTARLLPAPPPLFAPPPADPAPPSSRPPPAADVRVAVDPARGPRGDAPVDIDRDFYGMNVADWHPHDYSPQPDPTFLAYLRALQPGVLRWPAGHTSQSLVWEGAPEAEGAKRPLTKEHVEAFLRLCREAGARPLLAVNLKTGSPEGAADFVRYVNVERGHGVVWWQIGNEPDHRDGLTRGPDHYAERYLAFAAAMRAVDPSIRLVGAEIMTGAHVLGTNGAPDWMTPILRKAGREMDAVSWHYYPLDSNQPSPASSAYATRENLFQEEAPDWRPAGLSFADEIFPALGRLRDAHAPGAEIWVTEIAEDSGNGGQEGLVGTAAAMLWTADVLGRFAAHGPDAVTKFVFKSGSDHRFTLLDHEHRPRPAYYAYWLHARHFGDRVVHAVSNGTLEVRAHAALRDDGALSVVLVNKGQAPRAVAVEVAGWSPSRALVWLVEADGYEDVSVTVNGRALTPEGAEAPDGVPPQAADLREGVVRLPAYSIMLLALPPP